jgi:ABC-2 type transport system ATP-binding protein
MTLLISNVSKSYGDVLAVQGVSFSCRPGSVTGFIGPNGSGKSTTLKMIAGLVRPDEGSITFNGTAYKDLRNPGIEAGFLLDPSAHHPGRSVRETVALPAIMMRLPKSRVDTVLADVGLSQVSRRKVRSLSLGMRQRLSLAIALLGEPKFLVLDEPANGLDIEGMTWLKAFLTGYAANGGSVLVSSHLLNELETYAHNVVIIDRGRIVSTSSIDDLTRSDVTEVQGPDLRSIELALEADGMKGLRASGDAGAVVLVDAAPERVGESIWRHHVHISLLRRKPGASLEDYYSGLTSPEFAATRETESN